ncbi:MAG TPA: SHOCT domain-containing protein [Solirubrobacterales bacterium]|nr:SHOCT domain-containing protein [Solirubrobacterales bacterium]
MTKERPHLGWVRFITVLAGFVTLLAILSTWVDRQVFDTQEWGDTSLKLLQNPEIQQQVANYAVDELYANVDVDGELKQILPGDLKDLSGVAAGGLRQIADRGALEALGNSQVQNLWRNANEAAHKTLVDLIEDKGTIVTTGNGQVTLQLKPLIVEIANQVGLGDQARDKIPDSVGQIEIVDSEEISQVQTVAKLIHGTALIAAILAILLISLAIYLSPGYRWLTLLWLAVTLVVVSLLVLVIRSVAGNIIVPELATPDVQPAAQAAWNIATELLKSIAWTVIWLAVVLLVLSWLISPTKSSAKVREFLAVPFGRYPGATFGLLGLVAFIFLLMGAGDGRGFLIRLVIVIMAGIGAWFFRRQLMLEYPEADFAGLREFGERTREKAKSAWAGRPKNISMPKIGSKEDGTGAGDTPDQSRPEAETAVLSTQSATAASPGPSRLDQLEKLGQLKEAGVLDDEEFAAEKKRILGSE